MSDTVTDLLRTMKELERDLKDANELLDYYRLEVKRLEAVICHGS